MNQERLKELLYYDELTGLFTWACNRGKMKKGALTGLSSDTRGYPCIRLDGILYSAHRLAWLYSYGKWPAVIDHLNGKVSDNRLINLQDCRTNQVNLKNRQLSKNNISGIMGVRWRKDRAKWHSYISVWGRELRLYYGNDFFEACCLRKRAELLYGITHPSAN